MNGITTVYGIVSARGMNGTDFPQFLNRHLTIFFRVANANALKWINEWIRKHENDINEKN